MPEDDVKVRVQRPDGKFSTVPRSSLQGAMARGYKLAPSTEFIQGEKDQAAAKTQQPLKHFWEDPLGPQKDDIESHALRQGTESAIDAIGGMVTAPYHAIADPMTAEQQKRYGPDSIVKRLATAPARMMAEPIADAATWYTKAFQGKIPAPVEQVLSVGNEAVGTGAGTVLGGKLFDTGANTAKAAVKGAGTATRVLGQEVAGAGREPVYLEKVRRAAVSKERLERYQESAKHVAEENAKSIRDHAGKVKEAQDAYQKELSDYQQATAEKKATHAEKVKAAKKEWVDKSYEAKKLKAESDKVQGRLEALKRGQEAYAKIIKQNAEATHAAVKGSLDSRWNALNEQVGRQTTLNSPAISDAIEEAKTKFLMGSPESLKVFNDLTRQMTGEGQVDAAGGATPVLRPITWQEGRVHYSALGDRMYSGDLPGNVYKGIGYVRDALDRELSATAKARGAGKVYSDLKGDWSRYMDDWRDMGAVATGGSPLARVLRAQDPGFVASQVTGKAGERMAETLGRYKQFGGNPAAVSKYRALGEQVKNTPKIKVPSAPGKLELPAEPKLGDAPEAKSVKGPQLKEAPKMKPVEPVDPVAVRQKRLAEMAGRPFRFYDLFPPYLLEHMALKSPAIRDWIAKQPRTELEP